MEPLTTEKSKAPKLKVPQRIRIRCICRHEMPDFGDLPREPKYLAVSAKELMAEFLEGLVKNPVLGITYTIPPPHQFMGVYMEVEWAWWAFDVFLDPASTPIPVNVADASFPPVFQIGTIDEKDVIVRRAPLDHTINYWAKKMVEPSTRGPPYYMDFGSTGAASSLSTGSKT